MKIQFFLILSHFRRRDFVFHWCTLFRYYVSLKLTSDGTNNNQAHTNLAWVKKLSIDDRIQAAWETKLKRFFSPRSKINSGRDTELLYPLVWLCKIALPVVRVAHGSRVPRLQLFNGKSGSHCLNHCLILTLCSIPGASPSFLATSLNLSCSALFQTEP